MGYETRIIFAEQYSDEWEDRERFWDTDCLPDSLPDGALICAGFFKIADLDLCKCGYKGSVAEFFDEGREQQKALKRYASVEYVRHQEVGGGVVEHSEVVDRYDDPLGIHNPSELLAVLREEIESARDRGETPYRRYVIAEAMLAVFIEARLPALARLGAQAEGAKVNKKDWLFPRLAILSYGH